MKKSYDKLLLALAVLALLGGAAFYFLKSDATVNDGGSPASGLGGAAYEAIPIPDSQPKLASWPEPGAQSSGDLWIYDVFTPPKIYLKENGEFTAEPPVKPTPKPPFGIYLAEMERTLYRIQMQGFSGDRTKPEECVLFFFDEERDIRFFIRKGQENEEAEVEVLDFVIKRDINADAGEVEVTSIATILDKRTGEQIQLIDGLQLYDKDIDIRFLSREDPSVRVELSVDELPEQGIAFETPAGQYTLLEINLEARTVTVEKQAFDEYEAETRTLSPTTANPTPAATQPETVPLEDPVDEPAFPSFF